MKPLSAEPRPGILPLARKLGELVSEVTGEELPELPTLGPITVQVRQLDPAAWGYASQAEMDAAFAEGEE